MELWDDLELMELNKSMVDDLSGEKAGVFLKENVIGKLIEVTKYVFSLT